jgi:PKD repeat protein
MKNYYFLLILLGFVTCRKDELNTKPSACFEFSPDTTLIIGDTITFSNCSENATTYIWDFGDDYSSIDKEPKHSYDNIGNYKVILSVSNDNSTDTLSKIINIYPAPNKIVYHNFGSDISISTVRFFEPSSFDCKPDPSPTDSSANLSIDIDLDGINDFIIYATHSQSYNCINHCGVAYNYFISMSSLNNGDSIRVLLTNLVGPNPEKLDSYIDISKNGNWSNRAYFLFVMPCFFSSSTPFEDMIIGLKKGKKYGWLHVKPKYGNGIYILEYAINLTENNSILPGQKQ